MKLRPEQLAQHLDRGLVPAYLICGDEPLLAQEAADAIRSAARSAGFTERDLFHTDGNFDWQQVLSEANTLSLFADRKILEVRIANGKPGDKGSAALQTYCQQPSSDNLLLIITPKLDASAMRSKWVKAIDGIGAIIQVWPVDAKQMAGWIGQRLRQAGIRANAAAIGILADRVEGNLLAAVQEIEKLKLLLPDGEIDEATMSTVVADSARYSVFTLIDKMLEGDVQGTAKNLRGLMEDGTEPIVILWALARELRTLISLKEQAHTGDDVLKRHGVWPKRQPLVKSALRRLKLPHLRVLLRQAAGLDRAIKGMRQADPWEDLAAIALSLAGTPTLNPPNLRLSLTE
ncbi:MAG: DNA polymerase III subunit delta [Porticoccaceae bacterium]|nr:DNA polymerase III subunit delta [Porticoccaceae bacterium]